jgi:hypothetical protein
MPRKRFRREFFPLANSLVVPIPNALAFGLDPMPITIGKIINLLPREKDGYRGEVSFGEGIGSA